MTKKRIRIGIEDPDGDTITVTLSGNITREKILNIFEMMNLQNIEEGQEAPNMDSTGAKIWHIVDKFFSMAKFTSTQVLEKYEDEYNEPIKLSIISTYLSRFSARGKVNRSRTGREWTYQSIKLHQKQS